MLKAIGTLADCGRGSMGDYCLDDHLPYPPPFRLVRQLEELEALIGEPLPKAARASTEWWFTQPQSSHWQVESVYLHTGVVTLRMTSGSRGSCFQKASRTSAKQPRRRNSAACA